MAWYLNWLLLLILAVCLLAPVTTWGLLVWRRHRASLATVFVLVAAEAAITAAVRFPLM